MCKNHKPCPRLIHPYSYIKFLEGKLFMPCQLSKISKSKKRTANLINKGENQQSGKR